MSRVYLLGAFVLVVLGFFVYWPSLTGGFIWDDELLIVNHEAVRAADGLYRIWFTTQAFDYWPMTYTSFWLEWRLWGADTTAYHVANLLLHTGNAFMVWVMLRRLRVPGAYLAALIFLVHPVNVESVAWISQRKNTLSLCFMLLAMLAYERAQPDSEVDARPQQPMDALWYGLSLAAFTLAMLSKGSVVMLPFVLLLIAWWRRSRITVADVVRVLPFLAIGVFLTIVNIWFQTHGGDPIRHATITERLLGAGAIVWFYLYKALWPVHLSFIYPLWHIDTHDVRWWLPLAAATVVTVGLFWQRHRAWARPLMFAWFFFGLALAPVMGFTDVYFMKFSLVADHYQYVALIAVSASIAAAVATGVARLQRIRS